MYSFDFPLTLVNLCKKTEKFCKHGFLILNRSKKIDRCRFVKIKENLKQLIIVAGA